MPVIKLTSVIKDIYGKSGRALLYGLVENKPITESFILACVHTILRRKVPQLMEFLKGFLTPHYFKMLTLHLTQTECLENQIKEVEERINDYLWNGKIFIDKNIC